MTPKVETTPIYDERLKKWRVAVRHTRETGEVSLFLVQETFQSEQDAFLNAQVIMSLVKQND